MPNRASALTTLHDHKGHKSPAQSPPALELEKSEEDCPDLTLPGSKCILRGRMYEQRRRPWTANALSALMLCALSMSSVHAEKEVPHSLIPKPMYHYGARIPVECLNRSIETGEHIQDSHHNLQYIPFPTCAETDLPLELHYGIDTQLNCTIKPVTDEFYHLLEFYIHNDAPLTCRLPARPPPTIELNPDSLEAKDSGKTDDQEYVPLIFALAGTLQLSHLHVSTHMNILLHSVPKHHLHNHDSGIIDSGAAYSTSPLAGSADAVSSTGAYAHLPDLNHNQKLIIGDELKLQFDIRWFPTPNLPSTNGKVEWNGMGGHVYASTVFYILVAFGAGSAVCTVYFWGVVLPKRLKGRGRNLGGATPLGGYGLGAVGNGWGVTGKRD